MTLQLIYTSEATVDLAAIDLEQLLAEARAGNRALGITGVLVFIDDFFLQILEGEKDKVLDLLARIESDPRHGKVKVLHRREIDHPTFTSWSMAYVSPSVAEVSHWAGLDSAVTIGEVMAAIERDPSVLPTFAVNILQLISEP